MKSDLFLFLYARGKGKKNQIGTACHSQVSYPAKDKSILIWLSFVIHNSSSLLERDKEQLDLQIHVQSFQMYQVALCDNRYFHKAQWCEKT